MPLLTEERKDDGREGQLPRLTTVRSRRRACAVIVSAVFVIAILIPVFLLHAGQETVVTSAEDVRAELASLRLDLQEAERQLEEKDARIQTLSTHLQEMEQEQADRPLEPGRGRVQKELDVGKPLAKPEYAILTAYEGKKYTVMGMLSSQTKAKYAARFNYAYFVDNDLVHRGMTFHEKSAARIALFRRHWEDFKWLVWTDADVLVTSVLKELHEITGEFAPEGSNIHVIMSKDWGGRQVNPGVTFLRTSPEGKQFLDRWEAEIGLARHNDDLLAIRDGMEKKHAPELQYVRFVEQHVLNSYPHLVLRHEGYNSSTVEHDKSHQLWRPGHLFVHVVNCLRQTPALDSACCDGIAAFYWSHFMAELETAHQEMAVRQNMSFNMAHEVQRDWTLRFRTDLCLDGFGE